MGEPATAPLTHPPSRVRNLLAAPAPARLLERRALTLVWLPMLLVGVAHWGAPAQHEWVHDVARRAFYLPLVAAGALGGLRGGLAAAVAVLAIYAPHALMGMDAGDPASSSEKLLEMVFYVVLGGTSGFLAERSERDRLQQADLARRLAKTLEEVQQRDALLARASRLESLGELTAGLAHEIRNPLHAMRSTAEILADFVPADSPARPLASAHLAEIDRLATVLGRFLDFARKKPVTFSPVLPGDVIARVGDLVRAQAARQGTHLLVSAPLEERAVQGDVDQLVQVVLAICLNALQALGSGGSVLLDVEMEDVAGHQIALRITNDGPPIPATLLDRIFDPFVSSRSQGTGLGLAVAWRIVEAHGGWIEASNQSDAGGVLFRVVLPVSAPD